MTSRSHCQPYYWITVRIIWNARRRTFSHMWNKSLLHEVKIKQQYYICLYFWGIQNTQEAHISINPSYIHQQAIFTSEILQPEVETKTGEKYWKRTRLWHNIQAGKITPDNETIAWQHGCYLHCSSMWKQWDTKLNDSIFIIFHGS